MVAFLLVVVLLFLVFAAVLSPWRRPAVGGSSRADNRLRDATARVMNLEAARDAKYGEIRDAEMDRETGKLSVEDFSATDSGLRAEAVEILQRLDRAQARLERLERIEAAEAAGEDAEPDDLRDEALAEADEEPEEPDGE